MAGTIGANTGRAKSAAGRSVGSKLAAAPTSNAASRRVAPTAPSAAGMSAAEAAPAIHTATAATAPAPARVAAVVTPQPPASVLALAPALASAAPRENRQILYGLIVVLTGFAAILLGLLIVVLNYKTATDATAILGVITTAIAGLGGAFFGVAIGQQGTATANRERSVAEAGKDEAQMRALKFAANMDPAVARRLVE
jgi:uncharacterized membrane protein